jgi:hypothetical protein
VRGPAGFGHAEADVRHWTATRPCSRASPDPQEVDVQGVLLAVSESEVVNHLPVPPVAIGAIGFGVLLALLALTYAFRNVGNRH